jgi:hypothetical protein
MGLQDRRSDNDDGGLVFVSYSHHDREWLLRLLVLLTPLVRNRGLRVWADEHIQVGNDWRRDIAAAVQRARLALLLVSGDFLASPFIMEEELPALVRRGVRLAPVLVHDCLWTHEPMLADVQWAHDPGQDGSLGRATDPGERDRRLTKLCLRLESELIVPGRTVPPYAGRVEPVMVVEAVATSAPRQPMGGLDGVPSLPAGHQARAELADLIEKLLEAGSGAVGLTGDAATLGLFGQGGVGKSVQAAAVARNERVRTAFPDGVYWVTVGERADLVSAQLELLGRLGVSEAAVRAPSEGRRLLQDALAGRRVLLIVDDVWSDAAAIAFRVTGAGSRVIYTSRDAGVLAAVGVWMQTVDVLPEATALELLADVSGTPSELLP